MNLSLIKETDLFGRFFLKAPDGGRFSGYYCSVNAIRPLVGSKEWLKYVTGFYINVTGDYDAVRLSYFTTYSDQTIEVVNHFVAKHKLINIQNPEIPHQEKISESYGGEELRFRRFLLTYTLIGLDIMQADLLNARCLFATFRWQVMRARKPYKPHFERTFEKHSTCYNSLLSAEKDLFWRDLDHWPNPPKVDWAHFFVNMVLGCDWNEKETWKIFLSPREPLSIQEINRLIREQDFKIPQNWSP